MIRLEEVASGNRGIEINHHVLDLWAILDLLAFTVSNYTLWYRLTRMHCVAYFILCMCTHTIALLTNSRVYKHLHDKSGSANTVLLIKHLTPRRPAVAAPQGITVIPAIQTGFTIYIYSSIHNWVRACVPCK